MVVPIEFKVWLATCCLDGSKKLGLKNIKIAYALICEAQRWMLKPLYESALHFLLTEVEDEK